ncbi:MAG: hypothetical protein PHP06_04560 [Clostridia bacterium]|nr:hypothetical protein [Clostridia bacterium]
MKKKSLIAITILIVFLFVCSAASAQINRNETVYVNLNSDGSADETAVVVHLEGWSDQAEHIEYGDYNSIKNIGGYEKPKIEGEKTIWPADIIEKEGIYYQGNLDKGLPFDINIDYYLDGKRLDADELAGKDGKLRIDIRVESRLDDPLIVMLNMNFDTSRFSNIDAKDATTSILIGKQMNINYALVPQPDAEISVEMDGEDICLEEMTFQVAPGSMPIPGNFDEDIDSLQSGMDDIADGLRQISHGDDKLLQGMKDIRTGTGQLSSGLSSLYKNTHGLGEGLEGLTQGIGSIKGGSSQLIKGADELNGALGEVLQKGKSINDGLSQLNGGAKKLESGIQDMGTGLKTFESSHEQIVQLAALVLGSYPSDSMEAKLLQAIMAEKDAIGEINRKYADFAQGAKQISENTGALEQGFDQYSAGIEQISDGLGNLGAEGRKLIQGIEQLEQGAQDVENGWQDVHSAINESAQGAQELYNGMDSITDNMSKAVAGQKDVQEGLDQINDQGIKKFEEFLNQDKSVDYTSFVDARNKQNSTVRFVLRTPPIERDEQEKIPQNEEVKKGFWERVKDLFKF